MKTKDARIVFVFILQMTSGNLAVCFLPSLFRLADYTHQVTPDIGHIDEVYQPSYKSALSCLTSLIEHSDSLRQVVYMADNIRHFLFVYCWCSVSLVDNCYTVYFVNERMNKTL